jgi:Tfp pilus assembly protein PilV
MHRFLHPVRRRLQREDGFALVELMAALLILSVGLFAIAHLTSNQLSKTLYTRERDVAIAEATKQIETLRSTSFANLKLNPNAAIPATWTDDDAAHTVYTPLVASSSSSSYVNYQQSVTLSQFTFSVTIIIAAIDDSADGIGASDQNTNTLDYKRVIVMVSATDRTAFTYKLETNVRDTSTDPITPVQGFQVLILNTDGDQVQDDSLSWTIDIPGAGVSEQEVDEGEYSNFALPPGTYSCTINNTDSTRDWYPQGTPNGTTDTFTCSVSAGTINTYQRTWVEPVDCQVLAGVNGDLSVNVTENDGSGILGATVDPTPSGGQVPDPAPQTTGSLGGATFTGIPTGPYVLSAAATGHNTKSGIAACVTPTTGVPVVVSLSPTGTAAAVNVNVKYTGKGTKTWRVYLSAGIVIAQDISKDQTKTFSFTPPAGTYFVHVYCVSGSRENLRESLDNQSFTGSTTYWYPGPTTSDAFTENKC